MERKEQEEEYVRLVGPVRRNPPPSPFVFGSTTIQPQEYVRKKKKAEGEGEEEKEEEEEDVPSIWESLRSVGVVRKRYANCSSSSSKEDSSHSKDTGDSKDDEHDTGASTERDVKDVVVDDDNDNDDDAEAVLVYILDNNGIYELVAQEEEEAEGGGGGGREEGDEENEGRNQRETEEERSSPSPPPPPSSKWAVQRHIKIGELPIDSIQVLRGAEEKDRDYIYIFGLINSLPESGHRGIIRIRLSEQQLYAPVHVEIFSIGPTKAIHATPGADCNSVWIRTENNVRVFVRRRTRTDKKNSVVTAARISSKAAAAPSDAVSPQAKAPCPTNGSSSSSSSSSSRNTKTSSSSPQEGGDDRAQWSWNWTEVPRRELDASEAAADVKGEDAPQTGRTPDEGGGADLARNEGAIDDTSENDEEGRSSSRFRVATTNTVNESRCSFWESNQFFDISPIAFDHSSGSIWIETHTNNYTKFKINWML
mmetsp:Transcript_30599/g.51787  ORF Transcript_30599/g.51787 Transcript_30599/m.51787 type:complete len:480 (-) Transcript_30599:206-1645(-)